MRRLAALTLLLASGLYADTASQGGIGTTIAKLPTVGAFTGVPFLITDSTDGSCTSGGATVAAAVPVVCISDGTNWIAKPLGGSGGSPGTSVTMGGSVTGNSATATLRDWYSAKDAGATGDGTTNDATNLQSAINAAATAGKMLYIPDGTYVVNVPLEFKGSVFMAAGAVIKATATMSAVVNVGSAAAVTGYWIGGTVDANSLANDAIFFRQYSHFEADHIVTKNAQVNGFHFGDPTISGGTAYEMVAHGLQHKRTAGTTLVAGSSGAYIDSGNDGNYSQCVFIDAQVGMSIHTGGNFISDVHVWSHPSIGVMTTGFDDYSTGNFYKADEADTVSTYGIRSHGFNTIINGSRFFNSSINGGADNVAVAIHFDQAAPAAVVAGNFFYGADSSHRLKADYDGATSAVMINSNQYNNVVTRNQSGSGYALPSDLTAAIATERATAANGANLTNGSVSSPALATVNASPGTYGDASHIPSFTVNAGGQVTSAGSTSFSALTNPLTTAGDLLIAGTTGTPASPGRLAAGTAGNALVSNGPGLAPSYQSLSGITQYTASGTGAVNRTLNSKASDSISIKDYGAVCDGSTNDASAINAAITAAKSLKASAVTVPVGVCAIAASSGAAITLDGSVDLVGTGSSASSPSRLKFTSAPGSGQVAAIAIAGATQISHGSIRNLTIAAGTTGNTHTVGIYLGGDPNNAISPSGNTASFQNLSSVNVTGFGTNIEYGNNAYGMTYFDVNLDNAAQYDLDTQTIGLLASGITEKVYGGLWGSAGIAGLRNYNGNWKFFGTHFEYNCVGIILAYGAVDMYSPHFEATDESCGPHIESPGGQAYLHIDGGDLAYNSSNSGATSTELVKVDSGTNTISMDLENVTFTTNGLNLTNAVTNSTGNNGFIYVRPAKSVATTLVANQNNTTMTVGGNLSITSIRTVPVAFGSLPTCSSGLEGTIRAVTNSSTATYNATVTAGGTNRIIVYCNGTNWTAH